MQQGERYQKFIGPILTALVIAVIELANRGQLFGFTLAPAFVTLALAAYISGLRGALISAAMVTVYAIYLPLPPGRTIVIGLSAFAIAILVGLLKRKARITDSINGNIGVLVHVANEMQDLLEDWDRYSRPEIKVKVKRFTDQITNLATKVKAWHQLKLEIDEVYRTSGSHTSKEA